MAKYFCPKCDRLTYSLHYIFQKKFHKPKGSTQYCRKCDDYYILRSKKMIKLGGD